MKKIVPIIWFLIVPRIIGAQTNYYASPSGTGMGCGQGSPCSIDAVMTKVSQNTANMSNDIIVHLEGGIYYLDSTLVFGPSHSGTNGHYVIFRNKSGEVPIISGGRQIPGWTQITDNPNGGNTINLYTSKLDSASNFRQLYVNGKKAVRARDPNSNLNFLAPSTDEYYSLVKGAEPMQVNASDISNWNNLQYVELSMLRQWLNYRLLIDSYSVSNDTASLTIQEPLQTFFNSLTFHKFTKSGYFFENAYEFIDQPGEWYHNTANDTLYYYPRAGETIANLNVIAPKVEKLMVLDSTDHIKFYGLTFAHDNWTAPNKGFLSRQAGLHRDVANGNVFREIVDQAMVEMSYSHHITFERNIFKFSGGNAINSLKGTHDNHIVGNVFTELASSGIVIDPGTAISPLGSAIWNQHIANNYFLNIGSDYTGSAAIFATYVNGLFIDYNKIVGTGNLGINMGWGSSATLKSTSRLLKARRNDISYTGLRHFDVGVIHTKSANPGSEVLQNYFHDIKIADVDAGPHGTNEAMYLDDQSAYYTALDNVEENLNVSNLVRSKSTPCYWSHTYVPSGETVKIDTIKARSGLQDTYKDIVDFQNVGKVLGNGQPSIFTDISEGFSDDFENNTVGKIANQWIEMSGDWFVANDNGDKILHSAGSGSRDVTIFELSNSANPIMTISMKLPATVPTVGSVWFDLRYEDLFTSVQAGYDFSDKKWTIREKRLNPSSLVVPDNTQLHNTEPSQELDDIEVINVIQSGVDNLQSNQWYNITVEAEGNSITLSKNGTPKVTGSVSHVRAGSIGIENEGTSSAIYFDDITSSVDSNEVLVEDEQTPINECASNDPDCLYVNNFDQERLGYQPYGWGQGSLWPIVIEEGDQMYSFDPFQHQTGTCIRHGSLADPNVEFNTTFKIEDPSDIINVFRFGSYRLQYEDTDAIWKLVEVDILNKQTTLAEIPAITETTPKAGQWNTMKIIKYGKSITGYLNNKQIVSYANATAGPFGVIGYLVLGTGNSKVFYASSSLRKAKSPDLNGSRIIDFENEAVNTIPEGWTTQGSGTWKVANHNGEKIYEGNGMSLSSSIFEHYIGTDTSLEAVVEVTDSPSAGGVWFNLRRDDSLGHIQAGWYYANNHWVIREYHGTSYTTIGTAPGGFLKLMDDTETKVRAEVVGTTVNLYVNEVLAASGTTTITTAGKTGFTSGNATVNYDDIVVRGEAPVIDFEDETINTLPEGWTTQGTGTWKVINNNGDNIYEGVGIGASSSIFESNSGIDTSLEAFVEVTDSPTGGGVWFNLRRDNALGHIQAGWYYANDHWLIREYNGTSYTTIGTAPGGFLKLMDDTETKVRAEVDGTTVSLFVNEVLAVTGTTTIVGSGKVGFTSGNATVNYDDVVIKGTSPIIDFENETVNTIPEGWTTQGTGTWKVINHNGEKIYEGNGMSLSSSIYEHYIGTDTALESVVEVTDSPSAGGVWFNLSLIHI